MTLQTPCQLVNLFLSQSHKAGIYSTLPLVQERSKVGCIRMPADKNQQRHTARTSAADCCLQMYEPCVSILYHRPAIAYSSADGRGGHPTSYRQLLLLQQALAEDSVLDILLVLEDEAGNNGTEQCR